MKKVLLSITFLLLVLVGEAQIGQTFWFAAPDLQKAHDTLIMSVFSLSDTATVTLSQPANSSFQPMTTTLEPYSSHEWRFSGPIQIQNIETQPNVVGNNGLLIESTTDIMAYFEVRTSNSELYTLKSNVGLGTYFIVPTQYTMPNVSTAPIAYNSIEIVATENATNVTIIPSRACYGNHPAGQAFTVTLNKGQCYAVRSNSPDAAQHLRNTVIQSTKPIAVSITDDAVFPTPTVNWNYDLIGEQILPVEKAGTYYIAISNFQNFERLFIYPTENNTQVSIDGVTVATLSLGGEYDYSIYDKPVTVISSDKPIIVFQMTGYNAEPGGTILPRLDCSGSKEVVYYRSNIHGNDDLLTISVVVETQFTNTFILNGIPIPSILFQTVPNAPGWSYCIYEIPDMLVPIGSLLKIQNMAENGIFHVGIFNGSSSNCSFGYFSDYSRPNQLKFKCNDNYCEGDTVEFHYSIIGAANVSISGPNGYNSNTPPFIINNISLNQAGWYVLNAIDEIGCNAAVYDSIYINIHSVDTSYSNIEKCENELPYFFHGTPHYNTGTYQFDTISVHGCDSVLMLNFTVNPVDTSNTYITICQNDLPYSIHNMTLTEAGVYPFDTISSLECDSTILIHLTVNPIGTFIYDDSICSNYLPYNFYGDEIFENGTFTYETETTLGCDSTIYLNLSVYQPVNDTVRVSICEGINYNFYGNVYSSDGVYNYQGNQTIHGCDSLMVLVLTVSDTARAEFSAQACYQYLWHDSIYTEQGDHQWYTTSVGGCDSVETLHLTILDTLRYDHHIHSDCDPYIWNGNSYEQSGTYHFYYENSGGCDVDSVLEFTRLPSYYEETDELGSCDQINWHGQFCDTTGYYPVMLSTVNGCDSLVTLHFTRYPSYDTTWHVEVCESLSWQGNIYNEQGIYPHVTLTSIHGCDSIVTLNLTISDIIHGDTVYETSCKEFLWATNGITYYESGIYTDTINLSDGCDSITLLDLTIIDLIQGDTLNKSSCKQYVWSENNITYYESGVYTDTIISTGGCDSVNMLFLEIYNDVPITLYKSSCSDYQWYDQVCSETGLYYHSVQNITTGCDTLYTLDFEKYDEYYDVNTIYSNTCDSVFWAGEWHYSSGIISDTLSTVLHGCDSVVTLDFSVYHSMENISTIYGDTIVYVGGEYSTGLVLCHIDPIEFADSYNWTSSNSEWLLISNGLSCKVYAKTNGCTTLTVSAANGCDTVYYSKRICSYFHDVEENSDGITFSIKPNPAKDQVIIETDNIMQVTVVNSLGTAIFENTYNQDNKVVIDVSYLPSGIYIFKTITDNGIIVRNIQVAR